MGENNWPFLGTEADFHAQIGVFRLSDGTATPGKTITLSGRDGKPLVGLVDPQANGETLVGVDGKPLPTSDHGLNTEELVALPDGTFWVSDEYGPFLVHFDAEGKETERLSPLDGTLPRELSLRSPNQAWRPDDHSRTKVAASEITALSNTEFLIDERDGEKQPGGDKKICLADISAATDEGPASTVPGATYKADAGGLQVQDKPIETVAGGTTDAAAIDKLKRLGFTVAAKSLKLDLGALLVELNDKGEFFGHDKIEGLATPDDGKTLVIANDSDFGLTGIASDTPPLALEPKTLANGRQDSGEFLVVDTTKLPVHTETKTVSIKVG